MLEQPNPATVHLPGAATAAQFCWRGAQPSHSLDKREGLSAQGVWGFIYTLENTGEDVPRASFSFCGG